MGSLAFISDVIYGLKMDMGQPMTVGKTTHVINTVTGDRVATTTSFYVENGIYLPINQRVQFLKTAGIHKVATLESGNREILLDAADVQAPMSNEGGFVEINGERGDIVAIENYTHAYIVVVKQITGMP